MNTIAWPGSQPDLLALKAARPERYPALFSTGGNVGWDILFAFPQQQHALFGSADKAGVTDFFARFPALATKQTVSNNVAAGLPFSGGWLLAFSYELGGMLEPSAGHAQDAENFPLAYALRIPAAILLDCSCGQTWLMAEAGHESCIGQMQADLAEIAAPPTASLPNFQLIEDEPARFLQGVSRIQSYIREGDVFQVNLSRGWRAEFDAPASPTALFRRLNQSNPAPFSALMDVGNWSIISSSPERLVRIAQDGRAVTRPIAGTHPRSAQADEDAALRQRLQSHPKERAEHIMLVDLERNDLGRVCAPGSVKVDALMELASYAHVHHLESTVSGLLRPGTNLQELMRAIFPGGTITGCPKLRTMQIIHELEAAPRRAYTGSLGYINLDGTLDLNILIRSFLLKQNQLWFRTGAGIVADSEPQRELAETRAKAKGLLRALDIGADR